MCMMAKRKKVAEASPKIDRVRRSNRTKTQVKRFAFDTFTDSSQTTSQPKKSHIPTNVLPKTTTAASKSKKSDKTAKTSKPPNSSTLSTASRASNTKNKIREDIAPPPKKVKTSNSKAKSEDRSSNVNKQSTSTNQAVQKRPNNEIERTRKTQVSVPAALGRISKLHETNWLTQLLTIDLKRNGKEKNSIKKLLNGVEIVPNSSLQLSKRHGIEYAFYPVTEQRMRAGLVLIKPGAEKKQQKTVLNMKLSVLCGKIEFLCGDNSKQYDAGTIISIPSGVRYGLKNDSNTMCFLNFLSY